MPEIDDNAHTDDDGYFGKAAAATYDDNRAIFRYDMHTLPTEISDSIGTSTSFAAWTAAAYVAQIDDERPSQALNEQHYLHATRDVL